jgi:hypothetical protein
VIFLPFEAPGQSRDPSAVIIFFDVIDDLCDTITPRLTRCIWSLGDQLALHR